jgi:RHS repeat-associated protein
MQNMTRTAHIQPNATSGHPQRSGYVHHSQILHHSLIDVPCSVFNSSYTFSAKERDLETGYSYFGARYYDAGLSVWLSVDPMAWKYPNWSNYLYCRNRPIILIDPNGLFDIETGTIEKGDNLTQIAKQINEEFGTNLSVTEIAKANGIKDPNKIRAGDKIILPGQNIQLTFDSQELKVHDLTYSIDMPGLSWEGVSGKDGYQSQEYQSIANTGPIPEGSYTVDPTRTQSYESTSTKDRLLGAIGRGTWPGGTDSWGQYRTWLTPLEGTNTHGRSGFTIHGGTKPGSAGCIDLTSQNNSFHNWLKSHGNPIILNVRY